MSGGLGIRWTIGDVSEHGFKALRLSVHGAWRLFGADARYVICVNSVPLERARSLAGELPPDVEWRAVSRDDVPRFLLDRLDEGMAEGVGWKLAPLRVFPDAFELSLDNDCILWRAPAAVSQWLSDGGFVLAEDVRPCFGAFSADCSGPPRNSGIRGLPPGFDLGRALREFLRRRAVVLRSELDEQGMQVALLEQSGPVRVVAVDEVTICSPFPPHRAELGRCGVHFVGLNARSFPWRYGGRRPEELVAENFLRLSPAVAARVLTGEQS